MHSEEGNHAPGNHARYDPDKRSLVLKSVLIGLFCGFLLAAAIVVTAFLWQWLLPAPLWPDAEHYRSNHYAYDWIRGFHPLIIILLMPLAAGILSINANYPAIKKDGPKKNLPAIAGSVSGITMGVSGALFVLLAAFLPQAFQDPAIVSRWSANASTILRDCIHYLTVPEYLLYIVLFLLVAMTLTSTYARAYLDYTDKPGFYRIYRKAKKYYGPVVFLCIIAGLSAISVLPPVLTYFITL
jgi:hypothetical protein